MNQRVQVTLYSKPGCHLCEEMKKQIEKSGCSNLYQLDEINIESDRELFARYASEIPVLMIDGAEAFRHRLTAKAFRAYLDKRGR